MYRDLYSAGSTVEPGTGVFAAEVTAFRLPRLLMFERRLSHVSHERDARRVSRDGLSHVTLQLVLSGQMSCAIDGALRQVGPGEIVLFDTTQPQRTWTSGLHSLSISIARDALAPDIRHGRVPHGRVLTQAEAGPLIRHVRSLRTPASLAESARRAARPPGEEAGLLGALLGETLGALDNPSRSNSPLLSGPRAYARMLAYLDRHLGDRRLTIAALAEGSGVSRSALYRLFEPYGGVAQFIQRQRLLRLHRALASSSDDRTVRALATEAGFASTAHATRRFREAFGITPRAARRDRRHSRPRLSGGPMRTALVPWFDELL